MPVARDGLCLMPISVLKTKLYIPPLRPSLVPRPRLTDRLTQGLKHPLTLISAPVGSGKTTLVSEWRASEAGRHFPLGWLSLDPDDNDPARWLTYVLSALEPIYPSAAKNILGLLESTQAPPKVILSALINSLSELTTDFALVLDDCHVVTAPAIYEAISFLLDHAPPQLHLVMITRADPPLPLSRLRVRGELTEIRNSDLRFTLDEAASFLNQLTGLSLRNEDVVALNEHTEGWVAGLQLAALSLHDRQDISGFIRTFTGSHYYIVDYLAEEILQHQSPNVRDFMLQTSILDRLAGPLCDAVTREVNSQKVLELLEQRNLFVTPMDNQRTWFRYHHLFTDALRTFLQQDQPARIAELHRRASIWFEEEGLAAEAIQHALKSTDFERTASLIEQRGMVFMLRGEVQTVLGWLRALPADVVRAHPGLNIIYGLALTITNHPDEAETHLREAEEGVQADTSPERARLIRGRVATVRALAARYAGDLANCLAFSERALELLPAGESAMRASVQSNLSYAYLVTGDVTSPIEQSIAATIEAVRGSGNAFALLRNIANLARLQVMRGRLNQAAKTLEEVARLEPGLEGAQSFYGSPNYYFGLGDLLREQNELDAAEQQLENGLNLVGEGVIADADVVLAGYVALARLQQARGEAERPLTTMEAFTRLAHERHFDPFIIKRAAAATAQLQLAQGHLPAAIQWAETSGLAADDGPNYPHEFEHLTFARILIAQGRTGHNPQPLNDAQHLLDRLLRDAEAKARQGSAIEILLLKALALHSQGETASALDVLRHALVRAEPQGYIRLFADEGEPMRLLFSDFAFWIQKHPSVASREELEPLQAYLNKLLAAFSETLSPLATVSPYSDLVEPLTERELEIMRLLAAGASNREIAKRLVLSLGTVKTHIHNIYGKLSVSSRLQAVARARELGLFDK